MQALIDIESQTSTDQSRRLTYKKTQQRDKSGLKEQGVSNGNGWMEGSRQDQDVSSSSPEIFYISSTYCILRPARQCQARSNRAAEQSKKSFVGRTSKSTATLQAYLYHSV